MDVTSIRDRVIKVLDDSDEFFELGPIEDENDVIGAEIDGEMFFLKVIPA